MVSELRKRPIVPEVHESESEHRRLIAKRVNASLPHDGTGQMTEVLLLKSYTVSGLPSASLWEGGIVYVSDESGGAVPAFSDGTDWRRSTDRAVVS